MFNPSPPSLISLPSNIMIFAAGEVKRNTYKCFRSSISNLWQVLNASIKSYSTNKLELKIHWLRRNFFILRYDDRSAVLISTVTYF